MPTIHSLFSVRRLIREPITAARVKTCIETGAGTWRAMSQMKPAYSRATAATIVAACLPVPARRRNISLGLSYLAEDRSGEVV